MTWGTLAEYKYYRLLRNAWKQDYYILWYRERKIARGAHAIERHGQSQRRDCGHKAREPKSERVERNDAFLVGSIQHLVQPYQHTIQSLHGKSWSSRNL